MGYTVLGTTAKKKRTLVITRNAEIKVSEQCVIAASKGNEMLG